MAQDMQQWMKEKIGWPIRPSDIDLLDMNLSSSAALEDKFMSKRSIRLIQPLTFFLSIQNVRSNQNQYLIHPECLWELTLFSSSLDNWLSSILRMLTGRQGRELGKTSWRKLLLILSSISVFSRESVALGMCCITLWLSLRYFGESPKLLKTWCPNVDNLLCDKPKTLQKDVVVFRKGFQQVMREV